MTETYDKEYLKTLKEVALKALIGDNNKKAAEEKEKQNILDIASKL